MKRHWKMQLSLCKMERIQSKLKAVVERYNELKKKAQTARPSSISDNGIST